MNRLVRWSLPWAALALVVVPPVVEATSAMAGPSRLAQLSPNSVPKADTDQILGVVQGVAVQAGAAFAQTAGAGTAHSSGTPVGGVQAGFGGGARPGTAGLTPVVLSVSVAAALFAGGAVSFEIRRRRRTAER